MKIIQFKKKEEAQEVEESYLMTFDDIPKKRVPNKYIVVEQKRNDYVNVIGCFDTEIQALKIYRNISHNRKNVYFGTAVYLDGAGLDVIYSYEDIEIIY